VLIFISGDIDIYILCILMRRILSTTYKKVV